MEVLLVLVIVVAVGCIIAYVWSRRSARRAEAWEGTVDNLTKASPDGQNMYHYVMVRLANGSTKKVQIHGKLWKTLAAGDKLTKQAGEYNPRKVQP